jgi:ACR3 family arsenite efflux pump ArsB
MEVTNWAGFMAEIGCLFGLVICVLLAVVGRATGNSLAAGVGTILSVPCLIGAVLIANGQTLINAFIHVGLK